MGGLYYICSNFKDMGDYSNDYPGVIAPEQFDFYQDNCPNPNLTLKRSDLD